MTSTSSGGASVIVLQFLLELNIDVAEQEVQAAINAAQSYLPVDLPTPPIYNKINPADSPILTLALTSKTLPLSKVEDLADTRLAQKISQLSGVGLVSISGGQKPAVRVQANPAALSSYGINLEDVRAALQQTSLTLAKGSFDGPDQAYQIDANDQIMSSADYGRVIVAYRNGAPVQLSDVAKIVDGVENVKQAAWMNEVPAIIVNIQRQPGANIIQVVDRVKALLPHPQNQPLKRSAGGRTFRPHDDHSRVRQRCRIRADAHGCLGGWRDLSFSEEYSGDGDSERRGSALVDRNFRGDVPRRDSLNNLTLMALTISTGFVVDDAIVMIENIVGTSKPGWRPLRPHSKAPSRSGSRSCP